MTRRFMESCCDPKKVDAAGCPCMYVRYASVCCLHEVSPISQSFRTFDTTMKGSYYSMYMFNTEPNPSLERKRWNVHLEVSKSNIHTHRHNILH
jgi:hypothetical protein